MYTGVYIPTHAHTHRHIHTHAHTSAFSSFFYLAFPQIYTGRNKAKQKYECPLGVRGCTPQDDSGLLAGALELPDQSVVMGEPHFPVGSPGDQEPATNPPTEQSIWDQGGTFVCRDSQFPITLLNPRRMGIQNGEPTLHAPGVCTHAPLHTCMANKACTPRAGTADKGFAFAVSTPSDHFRSLLSSILNRLAD